MDEQEQSRGTEHTAARVVQELERVAFASFGDVAERLEAQQWRIQDGIPPKDLPAVASVRVKSSGSGVERDVKMYDKLKALEMLAKINGMFSGDARGGAETPEIVDDIPDGSGGGQA